MVRAFIFSASLGVLFTISERKKKKEEKLKDKRDRKILPHDIY